MLPSFSRKVDVGTYTGRASNTGRGSDVIVLIEAGASIRGNTVTKTLLSCPSLHVLQPRHRLVDCRRLN